MTTQRAIFFILPGVQILDLAGPVQVFSQADRHRIVHVGLEPTAPTAQGLTLADLVPLDEVTAREGDIVFVPGTDEYKLERSDLAYLHESAVAWLNHAYAAGARICSICTGAFVLAEAGLLDGRTCTTHWACLEQLRKSYPKARTVGDRVFCKQDSIYTSAGVATGIDLALSLIEEDLGVVVAAQVAKALVVYLRRTGHHRQESVYLDFRTHDHPAVHRAQNWIAEHPSEALSLENLARRVGMSPRNLTRQFKKATGLTVHQFADRVRMDLARHLMHNPDMTVQAISTACGYRDPRQFRKVWKTIHGAPPSAFRSSHLTRSTP